MKELFLIQSAPHTTTMKLLILFIAIALAANVLELTDKQFDSVVLNPSKYSLVKFYAEWCSHCKKMEPDYEELATILADEENIQIVSINANKYKKVRKRYDVQYYPTLMLFSPDALKTPLEYEGSRDTQSLLNFIRSKTHLSEPKKSQIVQLDEDSLPEKGRALTVFTASWCEHCEKVIPIWEKLAEVYSDDDITIGEVKVEELSSDALLKQYNVDKFPKIVYTSHDDVEVYDSKRDLESLVKFVNRKSGLCRDLHGHLTEEAGIIADLQETLGLALVDQEHRHELIETCMEKLKSIENDFASSYYKKVLDKLSLGEGDFVAKEAKRLSGLLENKDILKQSIDSIRTRLNILRSFLYIKHDEL